MSQIVHLLFAAALASIAMACQPALPGGEQGAELSGDGSTEGASLHIEPRAPAEAAPPVLRLRVRLPGAGAVDVGRFLLFEGEMGPAHLRQLADEDLSNATEERIVPSVAWQEASPEGDVEVVVAPSSVLEAGETYTVASGEPPVAFPFVVDDGGSWRVLERVWPRPGEDASARLSVWCAADAADAGLDFSAVDVATRLEPGGAAGVLRGGAVDGSGRACIRFEADPSAAPLVRPSDLWIVDRAAVDTSLGPVLLDPRPISVESDAPPPATVVCAGDEVAFGPGCAQVLDDRIVGRAPPTALLWAVSGAGLDAVLVTGQGEPFVFGPLPPGSSVSLDVATIDAGGFVVRAPFSGTTGAPMPHLVINEVLANPEGAEPEQEWVEILNDGSVTADLAGHTFWDAGGSTALPPQPIPPGGFVLLVDEDFDETGGADAPPAPGTIVVRVPKLGKNGLSNEGEAVELRDPGGEVVSAVPSSPKPKSGASVSRNVPSAPDVPDSFMVGPPTPGAANHP